MTTTTTEILPYKLQLEDGERLGALDDPGPLPEGMHQNPTLLYAAHALTILMNGVPGVFFDFNTFVYFDRSNRNRRVSPDFYVALGVDAVAIRERHGYLIWEVGKPPDFVLEIASESTATYDCTGKRDLYAAIGVGEYWRYDPTGGDYYGAPLIGERLVNGEYVPLEVHKTEDGDIWGRTSALGIEIYWGDDRLRVLDPEDGTYIGDSLEMKAELSATAAAYEAERAARLTSEAARQAAENEVHRLQEQLRRYRSE